MNEKLYSGRFWLAIMAGLSLLLFVGYLCHCLASATQNRLADMAMGAVLVEGCA